ncbi:hypothetical protein L227DRAFT_578202 [Lentinus tigrinus ALCF2SS1-6]|uniref:Uncharacterized protein n=1 Tax=Lentinus tigrinus ALCF2SS1-6 TaxID=1328759 RepID=A0A5C2S1I2_9APHY|nr:hypothetical protein L227DRAFT_578202 [Lentinus tigrinus ALCF2SS1-6]
MREKLKKEKEEREAKEKKEAEEKARKEREEEAKEVLWHAARSLSRNTRLTELSRHI